MIQRFWRFSRVALLVSLMTGCATVNDMRAQKASGLAQSYPVPPDPARPVPSGTVRGGVPPRLRATGDPVSALDDRPAGRRPTHDHPLALNPARHVLLPARPRRVGPCRVRVGVVAESHGSRCW